MFDIDNYKGIYFGNDNEQQFYEGGAHFKYSDLYNILENLYQLQKPKFYFSPEQVLNLLFINIKLAFKNKE